MEPAEQCEWEDALLLRDAKARLLRSASPEDVRSRLHVSQSFSSSLVCHEASPRGHRRSLSDDATYRFPARPLLRRVRSYLDTSKPRPLLRGVVHGGVSVALACGIVWMHARWPTLAMAFLCKLTTYACSATFHLYPRGLWSMADETRAFVADIIAVPLSISGSILPFAGASLAHEAALAAVVLLANFACVVWQTRGQVGLQTPEGRTDVPRTLCVSAYSIWAIVRIGAMTGFGGAWMAMIGLALVSLYFADCVAKAHDREPTAPWARWHVPGINSFHEDFHLALLGSDLCWLWLALSRLPAT